MVFLIFSIFCSITVAILLKLAKRKSVRIDQMITLNYTTAIFLSYFIFKPSFQNLDKNASWNLYFLLWFLLPVIFLFLSLSIKSIGIARTEIAQRLSLIIPIISAVFLFDEIIDGFKIIGLSVGFISILLVLHKSDRENHSQFNWIYPFFVFMGFGIIDVCFKKIAIIQHVPFTTSLFIIFCGAFIVSLCINLFYIIFKKQHVKKEIIFWGILLGILNFGNIFFYLKAHQVFSNNPSTVFATMNFGVILTGTLAGVVFFKEKLSLYNYIGLIMAVLAIAMVTFSQMYS